MYSTERKWLEVTPQLFTANGTAKGVVTIADTSLFHVKTQVILYSLTQGKIDTLEVKRILSPTQLIVGKIGAITNKENITTFTTADLASISSLEQGRPDISINEFERASYEEEPIMAKRTILVDKYGRKYDNDNPLPVNASVSIGDVTIGIDGFDPTDPDSAISVGSEDGTKTGIRHAHRVDSELDLRVGISDGANKAEVDNTGRLSVKDTDAQTILSNLLTQLSSGTTKVDDDATQTILSNILAQLSSGVTKVDDDATQALLSSIITQLQAGGIIIGTEDGTPTGTPHVFINNLRQMIMASHDRVGTITWLDIANKKDRRVDKLEYTSATFPGITVRKQFSYTLVGNEYVRTSPGTWLVV